MALLGSGPAGNENLFNRKLGFNFQPFIIQLTLPRYDWITVQKTLNCKPSIYPSCEIENVTVFYRVTAEVLWVAMTRMGSSPRWALFPGVQVKGVRKGNKFTQESQSILNG